MATLAWNTTRHMEAWYGIMGCGAICHTLNLRLSVKDLSYIAHDAQAREGACVLYMGWAAEDLCAGCGAGVGVIKAYRIWVLGLGRRHAP